MGIYPHYGISKFIAREPGGNIMDIDAKRRNNAGNDVSRIESNKDSIKKALHSTIKNAPDDETLKAIQDIVEEMIAERKNAIGQIDKVRRSLLKKILDEHKKTIGTRQEEIINPKNTKETVGQGRAIVQTVINEWKTGQAIASTNQDKAAGVEMTLEILPPRDQNAITIINNYLSKMPEILKVELHNSPDKSVFKLKVIHPVNLTEKLRSLPQILDAEEILECGKKKIMISLTSVFI
jgi:hypothetical protein